MSRTVLITGGTRGIGRACSVLFAQKGYNVIALYRNDDSAAKKLTEDCTGASLITLKCDVADNEAVKNCYNTIAQKFGGADILINNAGIAEQKMLCDVTFDDWNRMFAVNVGSVYNTVSCVYSHMVSQKWGRIINFSSIWGITGASCEVHYSASKAAVIGFTKALAKELGPSGVCVNCIAPGVIDTDMNSHLTAEDMEALCDETPLCRIGKPEEIASLAFYLASEEASFVTGQIISPNGGIVI